MTDRPDAPIKANLGAAGRAAANLVMASPQSSALGGTWVGGSNSFAPTRSHFSGTNSKARLSNLSQGRRGGRGVNLDDDRHGKRADADRPQNASSARGGARVVFYRRLPKAVSAKPVHEVVQRRPQSRHGPATVLEAGAGKKSRKTDQHPPVSSWRLTAPTPHRMPVRRKPGSPAAGA